MSNWLTRKIHDKAMNNGCKVLFFEMIKSKNKHKHFKIHPYMSHKDIAFYRGNKQINFDFSAEKISSDGSLLLLEKNERKHKLINYFPKGSSLLDFKPLNEADKLINKEMICAETSHSLRYKNSPSVVPCVAKVDMNNYICNT